MHNTILIFFVLFLIALIISFAIYSLIGKEIEKRRKEREERLECLSKTEEGKNALEEEFKKNNAVAEKYEPLLMGVSLICTLGLLFLGLMGIYFFIQDVKNEKKVMDIIFFNKGMYLFSPILVIFSILKLIDLIKTLRKNKP